MSKIVHKMHINEIFSGRKIVKICNYTAYTLHIAQQGKKEREKNLQNKLAKNHKNSVLKCVKRSCLTHISMTHLTFATIIIIEKISNSSQTVKHINAGKKSTAKRFVRSSLKFFVRHRFEISKKAREVAVFEVYLYVCFSFFPSLSLSLFSWGRRFSLSFSLCVCL